MSYAVKVRMRGEKVFRFLASGGYETRLRIHAVAWQDNAAAERVRDEITRESPDFEAKVVSL